MRRQTNGYLSSHKASLPIGCYQIILHPTTTPPSHTFYLLQTKNFPFIHLNYYLPSVLGLPVGLAHSLIICALLHYLAILTWPCYCNIQQLCWPGDLYWSRDHVVLVLVSVSVQVSLSLSLSLSACLSQIASTKPHNISRHENNDNYHTIMLLQQKTSSSCFLFHHNICNSSGHGHKMEEQHGLLACIYIVT